MYQKAEFFDPEIYEDKGGYDLYKIEDEDFSKSFLRKTICEYRVSKGNKKIFICLWGRILNGVGSCPGRLWISYKGNLHMSISFPLSYFKSYFIEEMYPVVGNFGVLRTFNHFAPGQFMDKFPNDIVCKEHRKKCGGIQERRDFGYCHTMPNGNLVMAPRDDELRKFGLRACYLGKHADYVPSLDEFADEFYRQMVKAIDEFDTLDKILDYENKFYNEYENNFKLSINNPNADLKKDGTFWTLETPNALLKCDHKGMRYQYFSSWFDKVYHTIDGNPDQEKPYHLKYEYIEGLNEK